MTRVAAGTFGSLLILSLAALPIRAQEEPALQPAQPAAQLTAAQKKQLQQFAFEFKRARGAEKRVAIMQKAGMVHPSGVEPMLATITKDLNDRLEPYRQQLMKAATAVIARRVQPAGLQEIGELRSRVLSQTKDPNLTKEMITQTSDPALERLKQLILIGREEVVEYDPKLPKLRAGLAELGLMWEIGNRILSNGENAPTFEDYLRSEEELAVGLALPMDDQTRRVLAVNASLAPRLDPEEARCILNLNMTRILLGLAPLEIDPQLTLAARDHSADMEKHNFFSHESPLPGKTSFTDRARNFMTSASGENIAMGPREGASVNLMWWHSPGHHKNMLGDHRRVGVGRHNKHWTELFGR